MPPKRPSSPVNGSNSNAKSPATAASRERRAGNGAGAADIKVSESGFDAILRNSTTNWNPDAHKKYKDHGLVYADYYLLEFGNKLLRAGLL